MRLIRLTLGEARALAARALQGGGVGEGNAAVTAEALVAAEADGQPGHGLMRVPFYAAQAASGKVDGMARPRIEAAADALLRVDAGFGLAYPALRAAEGALAPLAKEKGIAAAAIGRSHHFGQAGAPVERLAEAGLVALLFGNAPKAMAYWGGRRPMMGTNPIAFAAPLPEGPPLVVDLALSKAARGKVMAAHKAGQAIPKGWALGPDGRPTTDPAAAIAGTMAPMGGAKGAALALMVEVLAAALTGSHFGFEAGSFFDAQGAPPDMGHLLIAIDPGPASGRAFAGRMRDLAAAVADEEGARLPGIRRLENRAAAETEGLEIAEPLLLEMTALADTE